MMLNHLDLFSGIGGFALAARWVGGIRTIGFCDNEKYARQVLAKNFPGVPIYEDVRELHPDVIVSRDGRIDFLTCGFPCQDLSIAGNQKGIEAERSGLFFEITRLSDEILAYCGTRPSLVLENVANILSGDGGSWARIIYGELAVRGYCVEWKTLGATHVGAPHRRLRWWAVCYMADSNRKHKWTREKFEQSQRNTPRECFGNSSADVAYSDNTRNRASQYEPNNVREKSNKIWEEQSFSKLSRQSKDMANSKSLGHPGRSDQKRGNGERIFQQEEQGWSEMGSKAEGCSEPCGEEELADSDNTRCKESESKSKAVQRTDFRDEKNGRVRASEWGLGGMVDGIPNWLDEPRDIPRVTTGQKNRAARLKGLGNAVVPQCAMIPLMRIKEILLSGQ